MSFVFWWILALLVQKFTHFYNRKKEAYKKVQVEIKSMRRYFAEGVDSGHNAIIFSENRINALQILNLLQEQYVDVLKGDRINNELKIFVMIY